MDLCQGQDALNCSVKLTLGFFSTILFIIFVISTQCVLMYKHYKIEETLRAQILYPQYFLSIHCIVMALHYFISGSGFDVTYTIMKLSTTVAETAVLFYFFYEASILLGDYKFKRKFGKQLLILNVIYACGIFTYILFAYLTDESMAEDCTFVGNILLTSSYFLISMYFVYTGIAITRALNNQNRKSMEDIKMNKVRKLWYFIGRIMIFLIVLGSLLYLIVDLYYILFDEPNCSLLFTSNLALSTVFLLIIRLIDQFLFLMACLNFFATQEYCRSVVDLSSTDRSPVAERKLLSRNLIL